METIFFEWNELINEIKEMVEGLRETLLGRPVPKSIRDGFRDFDSAANRYADSIISADEDAIARAAKMVAVYGQRIAQSIPKFKEADENTKKIGVAISEMAKKCKSMIESSPLEYKPLERGAENKRPLNIANHQLIKENLQILTEDHEKYDQRIKKLLNENEIKIEKIGAFAKLLDEEVKAGLGRVNDLYDAALIEVEKKKAEINDILGHVAGRAIAGDFEKSAIDEKSMANWLRYASLGCMILIVAVVTYSFWESTKSGFNWEGSIFRIVLAFILSVPAAYLARESAKHREQQYQHQQTSLDLKAITPYIASLPEDEQHKIKIDIAGRLFAARDFSRAGADPYPINTHEIVMEIIKKLELKRPESKP